jgi:Flp pilus assembly pilin Flp
MAVPPSGRLLARYFTLYRAGRRRESEAHSLFSPEESSMSLFTRFVRDDSGQDLIEYGLLIGIITAGAIGFIQPIGQKVSTYFNNLNQAMP